MKNYLRIPVVSIIIFLFFVSFARTNENALEEKTPAYDFTLSDLNANVVTLSSYKDKQAVILFFWTTWCPFCRKELKSLNQMYEGLTKEGFAVLSINVGESPGRVSNFIKSYSLKYRVLSDRDEYVADYYGVLGVPTYVIIDKKGNLRFQDNYFPKREYKRLVAE